MPKSSDKEKLSAREKRDLIIQAGIQLLPKLGSSIANYYFGAKQEIRFKRLETFYQEVAPEIDELKDRILSIEEQNKEALVAIIEDLNEKIESEQVEEKRKFYKYYLKNILITSISEENFDERRFFLTTLSAMTFLECKVSTFLYAQDQIIRVGSIQISGIDQYAIVGAINRLKSYGFLISSQGSFAIGSNQDNTLEERVKMSDFGRRFFEFCLKE